MHENTKIQPLEILSDQFSYKKFCLFAKFVRRQLNENCDHRRVGTGRSICCAIIFKTVFERLLLQICTIRRSK